jgi:hypothetical protein
MSLVSDSVRLFSLLVRDAQADAGTPTQGENAQSSIESVERIVYLLEALVDEDREQDPGYIDMLSLALSYWDSLYVYLKDMITFFNTGSKSRKDTETASKSFLKKTSVIRRALDRLVLGPVIPDMGEGRLAGQGKGAAPREMSDRFSRSAPLREDAEHGETQTATKSRVKYSADQRQSFGYSSGEFYPTGGRAVGYAGEEEAPYGSEAYEASAEEALPRLGAEELAPRVGSSMSLRRVYDPATKTYDVATTKQGKGKKVGRPRKQDSSSNKMMESFVAPKSAKELPNTLEGFQELAKKHNMSGSGKPIRINATSKLANVRRNFIRRFGLKKSEA